MRFYSALLLDSVSFTTPLAFNCKRACVPCHGGIGSCVRAALRRWAECGGDDRDRTDDLRLAKPALSQLSYIPELFKDVNGGPE